MASFLLDETRRLRTAWRFAIFGCGFVMVQIGIGIASVICLAIYLAATGSSLNLMANDPRSFDEWLLPITMITSIPVTLCNFGLVLLCRRFLDRRSFWALGLVRPGRSLTNSLAGGLLVGSLPVVLVILMLLAVGGLTWQGVSSSAQTALLVPVLLVMAFNEEILCRGYLLQNLIDIRRPWFGTLFSSTVFSILHSLNPAAWSSPLIPLNLFGAGVTLALAYRVSRNIWFPTALHFGWNFAQGVLFEAPVSGIRTDGLLDIQIVESAPWWLTGGSFGIEGSILVTITELCASILLGLVVLKRAKQILVAEPCSPIPQSDQHASNTEK